MPAAEIPKEVIGKRLVPIIAKRTYAETFRRQVFRRHVCHPPSDPTNSTTHL